MKSYFVSDIHLKLESERNGQLLLRFLHFIQKEKPDYLFFMGDIFDIWIGPHSNFANAFIHIIEEIKKIVPHTQVIYFEGNHDVHVKTFWEKLGVKTYTEPEVFEIDGLKIRCEHGDYINPNDTTYLKFRKFARSFPMEFLAKQVSGVIWKGLGDYFSQRSRKKSGVYRKRNEELLRAMIRSYAEAVYSTSQPYDFIITGHMHVRDEYSFFRNETEIRSINLGSWYEDSPKALKIDNNKIEWLNLTEIPN